MKVKLWLSSRSPADEGYIAFSTVDDIVGFILWNDHNSNPLEIQEIYLDYGICCIDLLKWLEETGRRYPIRINYSNSLIVEAVIEIIKRNNWKEI